MKNTSGKNVYNPYLPAHEYVPDGEPHIFGERLYIFGSHDKFNGAGYCENDYVCYSTPVNDLRAWKYEGVIYKKTDDPRNKKGKDRLFAPDVIQGSDGRFYLYYALDIKGRISVAVCSTPAGRYQYYGDVRYPNGKNYGKENRDEFAFDPAVLRDDDGRIWLYSGFGSAHMDKWYLRLLGYHLSGLGPDCIELEADMLTIKADPKKIIPGVKNGAGSGFEGHEFFEASSIRKFNGKYYFIYSSIPSHELAYAVSDYPDHGFVYGGVLYSNGDIGYCGNKKPLNFWGNNHGSIVKIGEKYYIFGHRQTNYHEYSRQGIADTIEMDVDGNFSMAEMTSCGLNSGPLPGKGIYEARIACNLFPIDGACKITEISNKSLYPGITQTEADQEEMTETYIANVMNEIVIGFKYFDLEETGKVAVQYRGEAEGIFEVYTNLTDSAVAVVEIYPERDWYWSEAAIASHQGSYPVYFLFKGNGNLDFKAFLLD